VLAVVVLADGGTSGARLILRDWIPLVYLLVGYWLPAALVLTPNVAFEQGLRRLDRQWFGPDGVASVADRMPRLLLELLEVAYLFCYPLVPAGFARLYFAGVRDETDRFWTAIFIAGFSCYGVLPWCPTRPPRATEPPSVALASRVRPINLRVLGRASIGWNTFPSGHAATSLATALAVGALFPLPGLLLGIVALGILVGSITGRYHYAADTLFGALVALAGFVASRFV
jgi:membrane-associated phospholipid phosphatase